MVVSVKGQRSSAKASKMIQNVHPLSQKEISIDPSVTHASTNHDQRCLTSQIGRDGMHPTWYGPRRQVITHQQYLCCCWNFLRFVLNCVFSWKIRTKEVSTESWALFFDIFYNEIGIEGRLDRKVIFWKFSFNKNF